AHQHADGADREQHAGEDQEVRDRRPHATTCGRSWGTGSDTSAGQGPSLRRVMTIAATAATISSTEVTSNGKKNELNRTFASAWMFPPWYTTSQKFVATFRPPP